jgi:hypothetical protein
MTPFKKQLLPLHLADLQKSGLTPEHTKKLCMESTGPDSYKIPYFDANGKLTDFFRTKHFYKAERLEALRKAKKKLPPKYTQSKGTAPEIYLAPLVDTKWSTILADASIPMVVTEGEKKAACGCANGIATIGLGGTHSWRSRNLAVQFLSALNTTAWEGRTVRVVMDSDLIEKDSARKGAEGFVAQLRKRGAQATLIILPADGEEKAGMDDYIVKHGAEAFMRLLADPTLALVEPSLEELNRKLAVIVTTGEFVALDSGRVYGNTATKNVFGKYGKLNAWIEWDGHREVTKLLFAPGAQSGITEDGAYNTWPGWAVESQKCAAKDVQPWLDLLAHVLPKAEAAELAWVNCWFGYPVKHPGAKLNTALLIWSAEQGTGKNALGKIMKYIYGDTWGAVDGTMLSGAFNEWAVNKQFIVADELKIGDKRGLTDKFKDMITRSDFRVNSKNQKTYEVDDHINYMLTSNHPDAMYVEDRDRRMAIFHASENSMPVAYWRKYERWLKDGGAAKLRYYFESILDYANFEPEGRAPVTAAKLQMIADTRSDVEDWIARLRSDPDSVLGTKPYDLWTTLELHHLYDPDGRSGVKPNGLASKLGKCGIRRASETNNTIVEGNRTRLWILRGDVAAYQRMTPKQQAEAYAAERQQHDPARKFEAKRIRVQ